MGKGKVAGEEGVRGGGRRGSRFRGICGALGQVMWLNISPRRS